MIAVPADDAPWLPQVGLIEDALAQSAKKSPPSRDVDGTSARVKLRRVSGAHAFGDDDSANATPSEAEGEV
jgi:hypothetical protein